MRTVSGSRWDVEEQMYELFMGETDPGEFGETIESVYDEVMYVVGAAATEYRDENLEKFYWNEGGGEFDTVSFVAEYIIRQKGIG